MPNVTGIDHIYITVSDMARSQAFYTTVLPVSRRRVADRFRRGEWPAPRA